ncbi:MAG: ABC transporter permease [Myxococcota bacterium]
MNDLLSAFDWRSFAVVRRNALVYLRNWRTAFIPPAMEPVIFFLAFGFGLAGYVESIAYQGQTIDYAAYIAPGLVAYTAFGTAYYEALYSAYVRMFYQKTWDGILATQVELQHLVWGEILWAACRGFMNATIVCLVLAGFSLAGLVELHLSMLPLLPFVGAFAGTAFAAFGLIFTAIVPGIDHMNYPVFLIGIPLGLLSNTYFPVASDHAVLQLLIELNPVYQLSESCRALLLGASPAPLLKLAAVTLLYLLIFTTLAIRLCRKRILG